MWLQIKHLFRSENLFPSLLLVSYDVVHLGGATLVDWLHDRAMVARTGASSGSVG